MTRRPPPTSPRTAAADAEDALRARRVSLLGRWYAAGSDAAKQNAIVDEFEPIAKANAADLPLTALAVQLRRSDANAAAAKRLDDIATNVMQNDLATRYKAELEASAKLKALEGKPMVIAGKLPDGRDFSTADWKGKVILVDFWAVSCAPCRAELPRVKKAYAEFHDKGFEVLGVSNDYSANTLNGYVQQQAMPWPNLFDAEAAADKSWNPITTGFGIHAIPTMFLIDKAGNCRTISAREDFESQIPKLLAE
ncbi:MAG: TlpA disulfide reductase family protein [Tepidisphaeraceae bacterium]